MGGQGVLPVPLVYNGGSQKVPDKGSFTELTCEQRQPIGGGAAAPDRDEGLAPARGPRRYGRVGSGRRGDTLSARFMRSNDCS